MSGNVVSLFHRIDAASKRRSNELYDVASFSSSGYRLTWEEAVKLFLQARRAESSSDHTVKFEQSSLKSYYRILQEQEVEADIYEITPDFLRNHFIMYMVEEKEYKLNTINNRTRSTYVYRLSRFRHVISYL